MAKGKSRELVCPCCGKRLNVVRLLNESSFSCPHCRKAIEIRLDNQLTKEKFVILSGWTSRLMWILFVICVAGLVMSIRSTVLALPYFVAEWLVLLVILGLFAYLIATKLVLYQRNELRLKSK